MKKRVGLLLGVAVLLLLGGRAYGQAASIHKADKLYEAGGYFEAIGPYKDGLETVPSQLLGEYLFKIGDCYRMTGNPKQAEVWYTKAVARDCKDQRVHLYLGQALLQNEKYDLARAEFEAYKAVAPTDKRADNGLQSIDLAQTWTESPSGYIVKHVPVLNAKQDDYSPMYGSKDYRTMLVTSSRDNATGKRTHQGTGWKFADIFVTMSNGEGRWSKPKPLEGSINTDAEEGTPSFNGDYTRMYFTRCKMSKKGKQGCQILVAPQTGRGWDNAEVVPLAADTMVVAHPAITNDDLTLYFTANLPGGYGGLDIWKVTRSSRDGAWSEPINLGSTINTEGDECFPYVHQDGTLYFSSNGHPGMGGLDIFKAKEKSDTGWEIENMRYPINSPSDDFGVTFQREREEGFFSSRRAGGRGGDDIYWFRLPPLEFNLVGEIMNENASAGLANSEVRLVGSDGSIQTTKTDAKGRFKLMLKPGTDYVVVSKNKDFLNGKSKISTKGKTASEDLYTKVKMTAKTATVVLPNIFFDFDSWELKAESVASLEKLIEILNDNPTVIVEIGAHTDSRGQVEYNLKLSQNRAQAVVNFLKEHGVDLGRLRAKGYAQSVPFVVTPELHEAYDYLPVGQTLDDAFISSLKDEAQQEVANGANRRITFRVVGDNYKAK